MIYIVLSAIVIVAFACIGKALGKVEDQADKRFFTIISVFLLIFTLVYINLGGIR